MELDELKTLWQQTDRRLAAMAPALRLQERLARKAGVDPDRVVHATGASMANLLVLAAAAEPGDVVLVMGAGSIGQVAPALGAKHAT